MDSVWFVITPISCPLGHFDAIACGARPIEDLAVASALVENDLNQFGPARVSGRTSVTSLDMSFQNGCWC